MTISKDAFSPLRILLVEDSEHDVMAFRRALAKGLVPSEITQYLRAEDALKRLEADSSVFHLVVSDYKLPGISGLELCKELVDRGISLPLVLMVEAGSEAEAVDALEAGVTNYVVKDPDQGYLGLLPILLLDVVRKHALLKAYGKKRGRGLAKDISAGEGREDGKELFLRFLPDRTLIYVSDACCRYFSRDRESLEGQDLSMLILPEDRAGVEDHLRSFDKQHPSGTLEYRVELSNGQVRWQYWSTKAVFDGQGRIVEFRSTGYDITERKQAEEELRQSEERYRSLVENTMDGFFVCEVPSGDFLFVNQRACDLFGYSMQETLTLSIWDMVDREEHGILNERIRRGLDGESLDNLRQNYTLRRKDGSRFMAEVSPSLVTFEGGPVLQGIFRDVTDQEQLQNQLRQAHRMEGIATLAGGIAHQFNNALAAITGNIGLLEMDFPESETVAKYVRSMYESTRRMANLTNQLLAFARGGRYKPEPVSLSQFVRDTLPLIQHTIDPAIRVETDLDRDVFRVEADLAQLQMTLSAIIANATEAVEGEGRVIIAASNKDVDEAFASERPGLSPGRYVCLTIEDTGKGMDEETRARVFEPFFTTHLLGRGLGMAAVYGIVKNHGGWISVDSELGHGTKVSVYLPAMEAGAGAEEVVAVPGPEMAAGQETILVVEDEEVVANVTRAILERMNYQVLEARTGTEALDLARNFKGDVDLVILDVGLPDMRAGDVYALLMEARPRVKVLLCSGYARNGPAQEILEAGAQGFIQKPFSMPALLGKIREILED